MPYQGKLIGLLEMLDVLTSHERTEAEAVLELEHAIEDKAIDLRLPDGTNDEGETTYCEMSRAGRSEVVAVLRDFPNRMRIPLIRHGNAAAMFNAVRAPRFQFEAACRLRNSEDDLQSREVIVPNRRYVSDEDLVSEGVAGIQSQRWSNPHQAAQELAQRAEGTSYESSVQRLGLKIRQALRKALN
jgi:hypothetical protein